MSSARATSGPGLSGALLVYGSGGHGKVVADAARTAGWRVLGFADDASGRRGARVLGLSVLAVGSNEVVDLCTEKNAGVIVAVGDNRARARIFATLTQAGLGLATIIHPSAVIAESAEVGPGTVIFANAVVGPDTRVGANAILNTAAAVDHDCTIADHVHLAPGARTGGTVRIGEGTMLGISAAARNNISIGAWSMVGMGAVVVGDLPDNILAMGNPARVRGPWI